MILTSLEMQGFKSFPEKTTLNFGKGITAVVGPNGSGKSNISDAVRWVLGEQSSKSLRGSKMEDVIFDGTKIRKAHGFAQVTLRLDNTDRTLNCDADEVSVTRRYYRSGESEYKINNNSVRLRDVHELFMDTGLGRDGYSMVSQGKIADMVSGKGRECRDMLEEAAGISSYRYRRADSLKKLNLAEDNLVRLRDILSELEGRIGPLKTQSQKAEKFLVLSQEKKEVEIGLLLYNIDRLREDLRHQQDSIAVASGHYNDAEQQLSEIEKQMEECVQKTQQINISIEEIRQGISSLEEQAASSQSKKAVLENSIEFNMQTIERIKRDRTDSETDRKGLLSEIATEEKMIKQILAIRDEKNAKLNECNEKLHKMHTQGGSIEQQADQTVSVISSLTSELSDMRLRKSTYTSSIEEIRSRVEIIDSIIPQRQENVDNLSQEKARCEKLFAATQNEIEELNNTVKGYSMKLSSSEEKADKIKRELDEKSFEAQRISSKIKMLQELEKNMEGYSGAVKRVMSESQKGSLNGIHGTISQLITTNEKYAVAIETALGNAIQNIVTNTENDAKNAIRLLKNANAGRATFQPISSVKGKTFEEKGLENCDGFVDLAQNLIEYDEIYEKIISSLIGKVVIAEDLTYAIEIAQKHDHRFKIVTLDGQIINAGGAMTGGSQAPNIGILSRGAEIEKLKKKEKKINDELEKLNNEYDDIQKALEKLQKETENEKYALKCAEEEKIRLEGQLNLASEQYFTALSALDELKNEKATSDERIKNITEQSEKADGKIKSLESKISECEQQMELLGEKKKETEQKREEIMSLISSLNLEIHGAGKDLSARQQALGLLKARLVSYEDKDKALDGEIDEIKQKNEQIKKEIAEIEAFDITVHEKAENAKGKIVSLQKKRSEIEEESTLLRQKERNKTAEKERIGGEKARLEERSQTMQKEYDDTVNKLYDEYQMTKREAMLFTEKTDEPRNAQKRLHEIKGQIRALGSVNVGAIEEYKEVSERYEFMSDQIGDVEKSKKELIRLIEELTDKMSKQFREQFAKINENFAETFSELFGGGTAQLALENPADVLESNIEIKLQPPGKMVKRLDALSGGEKGLSAIALLFAIMKVNPAPFCIFDEVEAALDDVNVSRYAQYVRRMTGNTQFILITHRRGTMEEADMLYGITMQEQGVSKLLELKAAQLAKKLGITE